MDKMAYLQQISDNSSRKANSAKSGLGGLFSGKLLWVTIGALVVVVLFIVLMIAANSGKGNPELESTVRLNARLENLTKTISTYNKQVKSSGLRAIGSSLSGVLVNVNRDVNEVLKGDLKAASDGNKDLVKKIQAEEAAASEDLNTTLETGRMSGLLDRVYLREMTLQVALLIALEQEMSSETTNQTLKTAVSDSDASLENIHKQMQDFTDISI